MGGFRMESTIRLVVAVVLILVAAVIIIGLVSLWSGNASTTTQGFFEWFSGLFEGQSQAGGSGEETGGPSTNMPFGVPSP
jgi:hypothetical protein